MKTLFLPFLIMLMIMAGASVRAQIKCISFNIRYGLADDGENSWPQRKHLVYEFINDQQPDFLGLQEALLFQINEILDNCPGYVYVGRSREKDASRGEATPILYHPGTWECMDDGTLWLSETPEIPASESWNTSLPRIFTWAHFKRKDDGKEIVVYNTHFDHISASARHESSKTIISHMHQHFSGKELVLLGDLNAGENEPPVNYLLQNEKLPLMDAYREVHPETGHRDATFYGWEEHIPGKGKRIDYIFYRGDLDPVRVFVSDFNKKGRYPSDHMPVIAIFK